MFAAPESKGASAVFLAKVTTKRAGALSGRTETLVRQTTGRIVIAGADRAPPKRKAA